MLKSKFTTIIRIQSVVLILLASFMFIPLCIAIYNKQMNCVHGFGAVILCCAILGIVGYKLIPTSGYKLKNRDGFLVVTLMWIISSFVGALPFVVSGEFANIIDAFFESASGFTTTGASILTDIESISNSLLFWRSLTHWLGGMGIIVLVTALLPGFGINGQIVANAETPGPTKEKLTSKFSDTAKRLYFLYLAFTGVEVIMLKVGGMNWFDSFICTFGSVSTGGFSNYNDSIAHFDNWYLQLVIIIFMVLSAINFDLYFLVRKRGLIQLWRDEECKFFLISIGVATAITTVANLFGDQIKSFGQALLDSLFQVTSIITTTGFGSDDYTLWPAFGQFAILALFFIGGCSSSTGGGLKAVRVVVGLKLISRSFAIKIHPNRITRVTLNKVDLGNDVVIRISNFIFVYLFTVFIGMLLLSLNNLDFTTTFSASLACVGNVGPGFGMVGPSGNYAAFSMFSKLVCSFLMIIGRLEIYTVIALFSKRYWNSNVM